MTSSTVTGLVVIVGIGLVALAVAAWLDWRSKRRAEQALHAAPSAPPGDPDRAEGPAPSYATADELLESAEPVVLDAEQAAALSTELNQPDALRLQGGLITPELATHAHPARTVLRPTKVLVTDRIGSVREVLPSLERSLREHTPVLLAATEIDAEVVSVVAVNLAQGRLRAAALVLAPQELARLAEFTGATALAQTDLQAGYIPHSVYGQASLVVIDQDSTTVLTSADAPDLGQR